jgi:hypothetical protein
MFGFQMLGLCQVPPLLHPPLSTPKSAIDTRPWSTKSPDRSNSYASGEDFAGEDLSILSIYQQVELVVRAVLQARET